MAIYTWPTGGRAFALTALTISQHHNQRANRSELSGAIQTVSLPGMRWGASLDFPVHTWDERADLEGFLTQLSGMEHRLELWDLARAQPRGTCNTAGVTASAAAQFASALTLNGCGANATLKAGDWLKLTTASGAQLLQVAADATANGSGVMTAQVRAMLRGAVTVGAAVTLTRASALFVLTEPTLGIPRGGGNTCPAFSIELIEAFA